MKFGTFISRIRGDSILDDARKAEAVGFESLWIADHVIMPVNTECAYPYSSDGRFPAPPDTPFLDPLMTLTYAAAVTGKIRLATGIFVLPMRNAIATAKAVATLDYLSQGRVIFGVGVGWLKEEFAAMGATFDDRALRTREYLELMKELWSKPEPIYKGKTVQIEGVRFMPKTVQQPHPPIVFGGTTEPSLKRAVRLGDGWYGIAHTLDQARGFIERLREHQRALNRTRPLEITVSLRTGKTLSADDARHLAELGVDRALVGLPLKALDAAEMDRFRADVMDKM
ncbi:MAG TPA: LLM class F420-dependent oxidoreductase [Candidatus Binataceae bacterium]|nr:LLM class F420-dependent oxidoreductase [Candidatus Binataceae bacterium]